MKLPVCQGTFIAELAFENDSRFCSAPTVQMTVEAIVTGIDLATGKPLCKRRLPFEDFLPFFMPMEFIRLLRKKSFGIFDARFVQFLIRSQRTDTGFCCKCLRRLEEP